MAQQEMSSAASSPSATSSSSAPALQQRLAKIRPALGISLAVMTAIYAYAVITAPIDSVQGVIQKVLYVHPPQAYLAYVGFLITALAGSLYLKTRREFWDQLAIAGAEVGVIFCTLMLITGPIWARGTWGKWWSWDPRLTVTLLLWFVYLAYLLLRSFSDSGEKGARLAAIYGIVGIVLIPLNYYIIEIFDNRGMHPENLERGSLGDGMVLPFVMGNVTISLAFVYLLLVRWEVESLRATELPADLAADSEDADP